MHSADSSLSLSQLVCLFLLTNKHIYFQIRAEELSKNQSEVQIQFAAEDLDKKVGKQLCVCVCVSVCVYILLFLLITGLLW